MEPIINAISISDSVDMFGESSKGLDIYLNTTDVNGRSCVNCHLSPTGMDIVRFGKISPMSQDSIVVTRAMGHISTEDSYHVAAYIRKLKNELNIIPNGNSPVLEEPSGQSPNQVWDGSSSLTTGDVNGWDFQRINISFNYPKWFEGDEFNDKDNDNLDWLPELDLLTEKEGDIRTKYDEYLENPTKHTLRSVLKTSHTTLTEGERNPGEHGYNDFITSFDYQRWMATLYMQHIMSPNSDLTFGEEIDTDISEFSLSDAIWDVGNIARRSQDNGSNTGNGVEIDNRLLNEVQWLYLGWMTNKGKRNSFETQYIGTALKDYGQRDLASLVILRSLVSRSDNSQRMYDDIFTMSYITSDDKLYESLVFGLNFLINGINSGNNHFTLTEQLSITTSMGYLKNNTSDPDVKEYVGSNQYLSQNQKNTISTKVDILHTLLSNM